MRWRLGGGGGWDCPDRRRGGRFAGLGAKSHHSHRKKRSPVNRLSVILFGAGPMHAEGAELGTPPHTPMGTRCGGAAPRCAVLTGGLRSGGGGGGPCCFFPPGPPLPIAGNYPNGAG